MHIDFERQFEEFDNVIPYKYNWEIVDQIYSPRLYSLLQGINSNVDAMCRLLGEIFELHPEKENPKAFDYFTLLNKNGMCDVQTLSLIEKPTIIRPFTIENNVPIWWTANNKTKHELPEGASQATLGNVIKALAALVSLLHISYRALAHPDRSEILRAVNWRDNATEFLSDFGRLEFAGFTSHLLDWTRREYLHYQQRKYRSKHFYYISEYYPPQKSSSP